MVICKLQTKKKLRNKQPHSNTCFADACKDREDVWNVCAKLDESSTTLHDSGAHSCKSQEQTKMPSNHSDPIEFRIITAA